MKKRKGVMLPLAIILTTFIVFLGMIAISIASSTHKISYGNIEKIQSFYLAKAGTEIGYAFLTSSTDGTDSGPNWFDLGDVANTSITADEIKAKLAAQAGSEEEIQVYYDESNEHAAPQFYVAGSSGSIPAGKHYGTIKVQIEVDGGSNKEKAVYKITSTGEVLGKGTLNNKHKMILEVRMAYENDIRYY